MLDGIQDIGGAVGGPFELITDSRWISVADTNSEGVFSRFFEAPVVPGPSYRSEVITDATSCPDSLASLVSQNMVVLALGGDPSLRNVTGDPTNTSARCAILGVGMPDGGAVYSYLTAAGSTLDELSATLVQSAQNRSYVVTALSAPDSGIAYAAESIGRLPDGGLESFDTRIVTADESALEAQAEALADAGYVITAANAQATQFILVGTRPTGASQAHSAVVDQHPGGQLGTSVPERYSEGYAPMSYVDDVFREADGGIGGNFYIIWEK